MFDPGYPEFKSNPDTAWEPRTEPGAHPDEYISTGTYPAAADGKAPAYGTFLSSGDRLINYDRVDDFRSNNESFAAVPLSDPRPGLPIWNNTSNKFLWAYRGPGLWWDSSTQKIHFRASATHWNTPAVTDYTGEKDPRLMSLSINSFYTGTQSSGAIKVGASYLTFKNIVFQNGGGGATVDLWETG